MEKKTYALLIYRCGPQDLAPEQEAQVLAHHRELQRDAAARGELHAVAQLDGLAAAKTVTPRGRGTGGSGGNAHDLTDGPYIDTKEWLVGFYVLDCESEEQALARARSLCPFPDHAIEVRPVRWRWKP